MTIYSKKFKKGDIVIIDRKWAKEMAIEDPEKERIVFDGELWGGDEQGAWLCLDEFNCPEKYISHARIINTELARLMYPEYKKSECGQWLKKGKE